MTFLDIIRAFLGLGREDASRAPLAPPAAQPDPWPDPWPAPGVYSPGQVAANDAAVPVEAVAVPLLPPLPDIAIPLLPPAVPPAAIALIKHYEDCAKRLPSGLIGPYIDGGGVWTIGWGSTRWEDGRAVKASDAPITQARADALFAYWLADFDKKVRAILPPGCSDEAHSGILSLAYNVGVGGVSTSTALRLLKEGDLKGAAQAVTLWNKDNGKVVKGLQRRREAERLVMLGATPDSAIAAAEKAFP